MIVSTSELLPIARYLGGPNEDVLRQVQSNLMACEHTFVERIGHNWRAYKKASEFEDELFAAVHAKKASWNQCCNDISYLSNISRLAIYDSLFSVYHIHDLCSSSRTALERISAVREAYQAAIQRGGPECKVKKVSTLVGEAVPSYKYLRHAIGHEGERLREYGENATPISDGTFETGGVPIMLNGVIKGPEIQFTHKNKKISFLFTENLQEAMMKIVESVIAYTAPYVEANRGNFYGP